MAKFNGLTLNGIDKPDFLKVVGIQHSILPPISQTTKKISGKEGAYDFGNEIGSREIVVSVQIHMDEPNTLPQKLEQVAEWLYYEEDKKLVLGDDTQHYYMAKFTGDSGFDEDYLVAEGEITFICNDPFKYGEEYQYMLDSSYNGDPIQLANLGNYTSNPYMKFTIAKNLHNLSVVSGNDFIDLGEPYEVDTGEVVNSTPHALYDQLTSTDGWTNASSIRGGTVQGTFEVYSNHAFIQEGKDFGSAPYWHGGAMMRPFTTKAQDFDLRYNFRFITSADRIGRQMIVIKDDSGEDIFRFLVKDTDPDSSRLSYEFKAVNYLGDEKLIGKGKMTNSIDDMSGALLVKREKKNIEVKIVERENDRDIRTIDRFFMVDYDNSYQSKLAQFMIHLGALEDYTPCYLEARDIVVSDITEKGNEKNGQVPLIMEAGDVLEIDNRTGEILKNGARFFEYLNPESTYIGVDKNSSGIAITPYNAIKEGEIRYRQVSL